MSRYNINQLVKSIAKNRPYLQKQLDLDDDLYDKFAMMSVGMADYENNQRYLPNSRIKIALDEGRSLYDDNPDYDDSDIMQMSIMSKINDLYKNKVTQRNYYDAHGDIMDRDDVLLYMLGGYEDEIMEGNALPDENDFVIAMKGGYNPNASYYADGGSLRGRPLPTVVFPEMEAQWNGREYEELDRNQREYLRERVAELQSGGLAKKNTIEYLESLSRDEVKDLQDKIAKKGYYDEELNMHSKENIRRLQQKLVDKGYLKPREGREKQSEVDGIIGKKTREAYKQYNRDRNVDGILGKKTIDGYMKMKGYDGGWSKECSTRGIDGCAQWVTKKHDTVTGNTSKQRGVFSDAWKMPQLIVDKGGEFIYNVYDDSFNNVKNVSTLRSKTEKAIANNPIDYSKLKVGDIVGIYLPSSNMHSVALREGTTKNTHVGIVTRFDEDGMPIIEHNIHQSHRVDRANDLSGSIFGKAKIATVARPKHGYTEIKELNYKNKKSRYKLDEKYANPLMDEYMDSLEGAREQIGFIYPGANMDDVQKISIAVLKRETNFMNNRDSTKKGLEKAKVKLKSAVRKIGNYDADTKSSDLAKFKLSTLSYDERKLLGISNPQDLEDPKKAGLAVEYVMAKNYDYFKRLQQKYPSLGISNDDIINFTILSYNQGMNSLYNIGFDKVTGKKNFSEIQKLRDMAKEDAKIKDISSTNYNYVVKGGQKMTEMTGNPLFALIGGLVNLSYDKHGKEFTPYISAARTAGKKYITRRYAEGGQLDGSPKDPSKNVVFSDGVLIPSQGTKYTPSPVIPEDFIYSVGILPEVKITANDGMTDYQRAHLKESNRMKDRVAKRPDQAWVPETMMTFGSAPLMISGIPTSLPQVTKLASDALFGSFGALATNEVIKSKTGYDTFGQYVARNNPEYANIAEMLNPGGFTFMSIGRSNPILKMDMFPGNLKRGEKKLNDIINEAESFMRNDVDLRKQGTPYITTESVHPREGIEVAKLPFGATGRSYPITHDIDISASEVDPSTLIHELDHREKDLSDLVNSKQAILNNGKLIDFESIQYVTPKHGEKEIFPIEQQELLNEAYDHTNKRSVGTLKEHPLYEKSATNREIRYAIMKNANISSSEHNAKQKIDQAINDISDIELMAILAKTNGYSEVFLKNILKKGNVKESLKAVRKALIGVPVAAYAVNQGINTNNNES